MKRECHRQHRQWGIIADDLTGACDTGAIFAQRGFATVVVLNRRLRLSSGVEIVVVTTRSRNDPVRAARRKVQQACRYLRARRIDALYKKIDSTLKGNVLAETAAVMTASGFSRALICPAYPAQGRAVRRGILFVQGQRAADLSAVFSAQKNRRLVSVHSPVTAARLAEAIGSKAQMILPDAEAQGHLDCLVKAAMESKQRVLLAGSGGLTTALANALAKRTVSRLREKLRRINPSREVVSNSAHFGGRCNPRPAWSPGFSRFSRAGRLKPELPTGPTENRSEIVRPTLIFTGSNNPVTAGQIDALFRTHPLRMHSLQRQRLRAIEDSLRRHQLAVVHVPVHRSSDDTILRILTGFDVLFTVSTIASLVVIGGDTAALILRWLQTQAIELHGEIAPGIPWGRMIGGKADGLTLSTKAGGFGKRDSLVRIAAFLAGPPCGELFPRKQDLAEF